MGQSMLTWENLLGLLLSKMMSDEKHRIHVSLACQAITTM